MRCRRERLRAIRSAARGTRIDDVEAGSLRTIRQRMSATHPQPPQSNPPTRFARGDEQSMHLFSLTLFWTRKVRGKTVSVALSREEQIRALIDGTFYTTLRKYGVDPDTVDMRRFISIRKSDLVSHFENHPNDVEKLLKHFVSKKPFHDAVVIEQDGNVYLVYWMISGKPDSIKRFDNGADAATTFIMSTYGI